MGEKQFPFHGPVFPDVCSTRDASWLSNKGHHCVKDSKIWWFCKSSEANWLTKHLNTLLECKMFFKGQNVYLKYWAIFTFSIKFQAGQAVIRKDLQGLSPKLNRIQYKWIHQRILSMEHIWVKAGRSLSAKYDLKDRKAKQVWCYSHQVHSHFYSAKQCSLVSHLTLKQKWKETANVL